MNKIHKTYQWLIKIASQKRFDVLLGLFSVGKKISVCEVLGDWKAGSDLASCTVQQ